MNVAALYVEARGPYPHLVADWYDVERDARTYRGPHPIVAHPPCEQWGRLRQFSTADTRELAILAVEQVRTYGGVLEHPASSVLWKECGLPPPDFMFADQYGGRTYEVAQGDYGHQAPNLTWPYAVRLRPSPFPLPRGGQTGRVANLGRFARKATPDRFAEMLVTWAATARGAA